MSAFIPGIELSRRFYAEAVRPLLDTHFPGPPHAAALIGDGSEVLGFDTAQSSDHDWGPRVQIFLSEPDFSRRADAIREALARTLPRRFLGYSTDFTPPDPNDNGTQTPRFRDDGPINHRVEVQTLRGFFQAFLGLDIERPIAPADWLTFGEQKLRAVTTGAVFHDDLGLQAVRDRLAYYPHNVWLYVLSASWTRIGQEEHLAGRAGTAGDEIGSAVIAARLVRDLMRLCFLMERQYAPYPKWFGTAFARLRAAPTLAPRLRRVLHAQDWPEREAALVESLETVAAMHNTLGVTEPLPPLAVPFFNRPYRVIGGGRFADALRERITDPVVRRIPSKRPIGAVDQFSDSTDLVSYVGWRPRLRRLYE